MKTLKCFSLMIILLNCLIAVEFARNWPESKLLAQLTPDKFKNMDAVVILKEQSFTIHSTSVDYMGATLFGNGITTTQIRIVKLFNERAVERYGTLEYTYEEQFGDEIPNKFTAIARILKPDGKEINVPEKFVQNIVSVQTDDGTPLVRKAIMKIPDLKPGDIIQIEYSLMENLCWTSSNIFFYNDRDYILYSNLHITLPFKEDAKYYSIPLDRIGQPNVQQVAKYYGAGKTYSWCLQNLNAIPDEPFSLPFEDLSMLTAFVIDTWTIDGATRNNWDKLSDYYFSKYFKPKTRELNNISKIGIPELNKKSKITWQNIDTVYSALRKAILLNSYNSLYPANQNIDRVVKDGKGDASDCCYIMNHILCDWNVQTNAVWIRDRRDGIFEKEIPTVKWFDRLGLLVTLNREEKIYDFDTSIPTEYHLPWYLKGIDVAVVNDKSLYFKTLDNSEKPTDNTLIEKHVIQFNDEEMTDQIELKRTGALADKYRSDNYGNSDLVRKENIKSIYMPEYLNTIESVSFNNYTDSADVIINLNGKSAMQEVSIEKNRIIKLNNRLVKTFRDQLFSVSRSTTVNLWFPFQYQMTWEIEIPQGYKVQQSFSEDVLYGPSFCRVIMTAAESENQLIIKGVMEFPKYLIPVNQYNQLIKFLDDVSDRLDIDIVFEPA